MCENVKKGNSRVGEEMEKKKKILQEKKTYGMLKEERQNQRQRERIGEKNYKEETTISFFSSQLHQSLCIHVPV